VHDEILIDFASALVEEAINILHGMEGDASGRKGSLLFDPERDVSLPRIVQVVHYAYRDLQRLAHDQGSEVSSTKVAAYYAFWFAKLKPIVRVNVIPPGDVKEKEMVDVNERVSIFLAGRLLRRIAAFPEKYPNPIWSRCTKSDCVIDSPGRRGKCFYEKMNNFLSLDNEKFSEYLHYSLRYRAVSPYLLVAQLDQAIFLSCESACPPLFRQ
jgi:hypothetical protein